MKRFAALLACCALFTALATTPVHSQVSYMAAVFTDFVVDNGAVPYEGPVIQAEIGYKFRFGLYGRAWASRGEKGGREIDGTLGYQVDCLDASVGFFRHAGGGPDDIVQSSARFGCVRETKRRSVKPYVGIDRIHVRHRPDYSGWFYRAGLQYEQKRQKDLSILQEISVLYDTGIFDGERGFVFRYELARARKYGGEHGYAVTSLGRLSVPLGPTNRDRDVQIVGGLKVTH